MTRFPIVIAVLPLFVCSSVFAQVVPPKMDTLISLSDVAVAVLATIDGESVLTLQTPKKEARQGMRTIHRPARYQEQTYKVKVGDKVETRTRKVAIPGGGSTQEPYIYYIVKGLKKTSVSLDKSSVWTLTGKKLTKDDVKKRLAKPTSVIQISRPITKGKPVDAFYTAVLKPNTLFIHVDVEK